MVHTAAVGLDTAEEQLCGVAHRPLIAVGHIRQVVRPVDAHHVPHMSVAIHRAGNVQRLHGADPAVALLRQVAQVLERLGVALAHHIGAGVAVKHPQQLPGIAVDCVLVDAEVVGDLVADILPVCLQLVIVGLAAVGRHHLLGCRHRRRHGGNIGGVQTVAAELRGHREFERDVLPAVIRYIRIADAHRLVVPVQRIRQIRQQRLPHLVRRGLIRQRARDLDRRVLPLSVGDQDQLLLQGVVRRLLRRRQVPGCGVHGRCAGRVKAPFIVGDVHACQLVQIAIQQRAVGCRLRGHLRSHSLHRQQRQRHHQRQCQCHQALSYPFHNAPPHIFRPHSGALCLQLQSTMCFRKCTLLFLALGQLFPSRTANTR